MGEGALDLVKDSDQTNFAKDVLEASRTVPVIVDFWAPWCGPCKQLQPVIEKVVRAAKGLVTLVKINIDQNQMLAQQLRIQSIPAVYAFFGGRPVDGFMGAVPESQVKQFVDRLIQATAVEGDEIVELLEHAKAALAQNDFDLATRIYEEILGVEPTNLASLGGMARHQVETGNVDRAKELLNQIVDCLTQKPNGARGQEIADYLKPSDLAATPSDIELAAPRFKQSLELDPKHVGALIGMAHVNLSTGQLDGAKDVLNKLIDRLGELHKEGVAERTVAVTGPPDAPLPDVSKTAERTGGIFISYRRSDESGFAGRLYDWLSRAFDKTHLFMDVDSIPPGVDFVDYLSSKVEECDIFLAIIGRNWRGNPKPGGGYQIEEEEDFVRIEIAAALERGKKVIPVFINDTQFLAGSDLPPSIKPLTRRQAVRIRHDNFRADMERLINALKHNR